MHADVKVVSCSIIVMFNFVHTCYFTQAVGFGVGVSCFVRAVKDQSASGLCVSPGRTAVRF